jgi:hypothetical protein
MFKKGSVLLSCARLPSVRTLNWDGPAQTPSDFIYTLFTLYLHFIYTLFTLEKFSSLDA